MKTQKAIRRETPSISVSLIVMLVITTGIVALINYIALPAFTLRSPGFWTFASVTAFLYAGVIYMHGQTTADREKERKLRKIWLVPTAIICCFLIASISSFYGFWRSIPDRAHNVAKVTKSELSITEAFGDVVETENLNTLPLVDLDSARTLGDKKVAMLSNASWYDVDDEYNLVKTANGYARLSVIDYGDYFKFNKAESYGLPGYVLVNVMPENGTITQDANIVQTDKPIRYSPGAFFSKDLTRHLRNQYRSYMFDKSFLEIDDEGNPYWVTGVLRPTAGAFSVQTVTTFILTNAQTGESQEYAVSDAPEWIDHIYSLDYLMTIAKWHYSYVDGFWNAVGGKAGVLKTSYAYRDRYQPSAEHKTAASEFANFFGYSSIIDKDGNILFYTGLTAANISDSNSGWLTVSPRTGEIIQYDIVGASENSAQTAVESIVQAEGYEATFPIPTVIANEPSYIMCLKGKAGLVQGYGICNVENFSIAVQASTLPKAIALYQQKLGMNVAGGVPFDEEPENLTDEDLYLTTSGKIDEIYTAELNGTTQFYYIVAGRLYRASLAIDERQVTYRVGDYITFSYIDRQTEPREIFKIHLDNIE